MKFHPFVSERDGWSTLQREPQYADPYVLINRVVVATPSRPSGVPWTVAHRKAASVVIPRLEDGRFLMIRQERIPILDRLWEFPAGQIDSAPHAPEALEALAVETALRELREESGHRLAPGARLIPLGHFFASAGFTDEVSFLFLATAVAPDPEGTAFDDGEAILECRAFSPDELRHLIASGEIRDANSLAAFARLSARGDL